ncbi:unnamed protein product [Dibothriocephalus latus]|uniref:Uncharacterized protein n=1 Tax=Dibothriocephalus latus TaxID=60516 RepID=A0A3P6QW42_DIBLA|nr:unnamed protein product [Dibothriocephalus latus]
MSNADWIDGPLQQEPPKDFKPQALDPEPADLKPTPYAYVAQLDMDHAILPGDHTYEVRIHWYLSISSASSCLMLLPPTLRKLT